MGDYPWPAVNGQRRQHEKWNHYEGKVSVMKGWRGRLRVSGVVAVLVLVAGGVSASQALATVPHSATGVIATCYDANGALRVIDTQLGRTCAIGETQLGWNATTISATQWSSTAIVRMVLNCAVPQIAMRQPTSPLPAGSWLMTADVTIASSYASPIAFRCWGQARSGLQTFGPVVDEWSSVTGWHHSFKAMGLVTLAQPDSIDIVCSHDNDLTGIPAGVIQIESVQVIVQRVATIF